MRRHLGRKGDILLSLAVFLATLTIGGVIIDYSQAQRISEQQKKAAAFAHSHGDALERYVHRSMAATYALASVVRQGNGRIEDFEGLAEEFLKSYPGISNLQLAPGGIIERIHPLAGNEKAIGHNLLDDSARNKQARLAIETGELTLAGPFELVQGGQAVIGRNPVFLSDDRGGKRFWGFTTALIYLPDLLRASGLEGIAEAGYEYELSRIHPDSKERQVFGRSGQSPLAETVNSDIIVPNGLWTLSIAPLEGWSRSSWFDFQIGLTLLASFLNAFFVLHLLRQPRLLRREVRARTVELEEKNEALQAESSRRLRAQEELRAAKDNAEGANRMLESLFLTAPAAIVAINKKGQVTLWNERAEELFGWSEEEIIGRPYPLVPDDEIETEQGLRKRVFEGERLRGVEVRRKTKDGRIVEALLSAASLRNEQGQIIGSMGIMEDVSERKKAELALKEAKEEAEKANRVKGDFLANISHELRTPMNGVIGMTDLVLDTELSEEQRECLGMAGASARSLLGLLNDVLDFSKIEAGKLALESCDFDLRETFGGVQSVLAVQARKKGLDLRFDYHPDVPLNLKGDPGRLRQVIINLVGNAIKFTDTGEVSVRVSRLEKSLLQFDVSDTGIGIAPERQQEIFESFAQADGSVTRKYGGTGLGLAISKAIVEAMGGEIRVESSPGKGSTFSFTAAFDLGEALEAVAPQPSPPRAGNGNSPLKILLAEDNPVNQKLASRILEKRGHLVTVADNGREALAVLATKRFDLVLMDVQMPEMDGIEATRSIRSSDPERIDPQIPIVALTAHAMKGDKERFLEAGMNGYLSKPLDAESLIEAVEKHGRMPACSRKTEEVEEPLDIEAAMERLDGDGELLEEILEVFLESAPDQLEELKAALEAGDGNRIEMLSHALKGAAANIGADPLRRVAYGMEIAAREKSLEAARALGADLEKNFRLLITRIAGYLAGVRG